MTNKPSQSSPSNKALASQHMHEETLDPANEALSDALRKSFRILKLLMFVLVVLYAVSGWFQVEPNEVALVLRYGRVVGAGPNDLSGDAVLEAGWHWSWPFPFDRHITFPTNPREIDVSFMYELSGKEIAGGISGYRYDNLSPRRDDYLITGDANILHASVKVRYRIVDAVAYATNVYEKYKPDLALDAPEYERYPEYELMSNIVRNAAIETAAKREALKIRGENQTEFLLAVADDVNQKLKALENEGVPLGIEVDPETGIYAPKKSGVEAIMPPRQTQKAFDDVVAAENTKAVQITKARSSQQAQLVNMAGPLHEEIAAAIDAEFNLMMQLSKLESNPGDAEPTKLEGLRTALAQQRAHVEKLLTTGASGEVKAILRDAEITRDGIIKEATGDYERFLAVLPEYLQNPGIFQSRLLDETYAWALNSNEISKIYVPKDGLEHRLHIYPDDKPVTEKNRKGRDSKTRSSGSSDIPRAARP